MNLPDDAMAVLRAWADFAPLINLVLLVLALGGLIALNSRMRK